MRASVDYSKKFRKVGEEEEEVAEEDEAHPNCFAEEAAMEEAKEKAAKAAEAATKLHARLAALD